MIVTCEKCSTSFNLDESLLKSTGSKVRCSKCKHVFTTYPPEPVEEQTLEESIDLEPAVGEDTDAGTPEDSDFLDEQAAGETSLEIDEPGDVDLSDIEKMLEAEEDAEEDVAAEDDAASEGASFDAVGDSLDLSDIEDILDSEALGDDLTDDTVDEDEDLVFDLDETLEMEAGEEQISPTSELDLGDLEKMFESDDDEPDFSLEDEPGLEDELGLEDEPELEKDASLSDELDAGELLSIDEEDLEIETEEETTPSESAEKEENLLFDMEDVETEEDESPQPSSEGEELELEFDLEEVEEDSSEVSEAEAVETEEPQELEFNLEEVEESVSEASDAEAGDLAVSDSDDDMELKLEMEEETDSDVQEIESPELLMEDEEAEVSDLDGALETEEVAGDFLESISEEEKEAAGEEEAEEFTIGLDEETSDEESLDLDEEDIEVDFPDDAVPDIPDEEEDLMDEDESEQDEDIEEDEDASEEISASQPVEEKSGLKKFVVWLVAVVVVIVIALGALVFLTWKGIVNVPILNQLELPFIGKVKPSEAPDSNAITILTSGVQDRQLDSEKAGKLFIVSGKVKNNSGQPHSYIQVSSSLYTRGATLAQTVTAYCGNVLPDEELLKLGVSEIKALMENRAGKSNSNIGVKPGAEVPFMIVFFDIPDPKNLEEYNLTVLGSSVDGK